MLGSPKGSPKFSLEHSLGLLEINFKVIPLFCTAHNIATSEMGTFHPGHLKRGHKGRFCCSRAFKSNHDNSSRLRRCSFGTRPSLFADNDHFEAKIAPLPSIITVLRRNEHGDPPFLMILFTHNWYTENIFSGEKKLDSRPCSIYI